MAYSRKRCRICGLPAQANRRISTRGKCPACAVHNSASQTRRAIDTAIEVDVQLPGADLETGIRRMISYSRQMHTPMPVRPRRAKRDHQ